jgi:hypothetical protein
MTQRLGSLDIPFTGVKPVVLLARGWKNPMAIKVGV